MLNKDTPVRYIKLLLVFPSGWEFMFLVSAMYTFQLTAQRKWNTDRWYGSIYSDDPVTVYIHDNLLLFWIVVVIMAAITVRKTLWNGTLIYLSCEEGVQDVKISSVCT